MHCSKQPLGIAAAIHTRCPSETAQALLTFQSKPCVADTGATAFGATDFRNALGDSEMRLSPTDTAWMHLRNSAANVYTMTIRDPGESRVTSDPEMG